LNNLGNVLNRTLYNDVYLKGAGYGNTHFIANNGGKWKGNIYVYDGFTFHTNTKQYTFTIEGDIIFKANCSVSFTGGAGNNPTSPTATAHWRYGRLQNMHCTTDGSLTAMNSKFVIADTATFSNLTELVACGKVNPMTINSKGINPVDGLRTLAVTNTATMEFATNMVQKTRDVYLASTAKLKIGKDSYVKASHRAYLDGETLPAGVYGKVNGKYADGSDIPARFQRTCLTGDGWLQVDGPKGLAIIVR